jgi:hypothetical protein
MRGTMMILQARIGLFALAALAAGTAAVLAADPLSRHKGDPATFTGSSFGPLVTMIGDDDTVTATFDNGGKFSVKGNMNNPNYVGFWTDTECDAEKDGTKYWGKIEFAMSDAGRTYTGKWGSCDAAPDQAFVAKWDGK